EPIHVPAIELPTWDTGILSDDTDAAAGVSEAAPSEQADDGAPAEEAGDEEATEPSWVDSITDEQEETAADLPTFTYEDDTSAEAEIPSVDEDEDAVVEAIAEHPLPPVSDEPVVAPSDAADTDDDPLGLAAHLAGRSPDAGHDAVQASQPEPATAAQTESDWLDEIADDDTIESDEPQAAVSDDLDTAEEILEPGAAEPAQPTAGASIEDAAAATESADEAAREMAAAPPAEPPAAPPAETVEPPPAPPVPPARDDYIDLGAFITDDDEEESTRFRVRETAPTGDEDRDFAELLSQFKAKVHEHLPAEDAAAHYDLGLAF